MLLRKIVGEKNWKRLRDLRLQYFSSDAERESFRESKINAKKRIAFYSAFVQKGDLCFDVGANVGNRITPLLDLGAKVLAVEPQEKCYTFLKKEFGNKIILITKGLSDKEEIKDFHISDATTISSFSEEWINLVKEDRFKDYQWNKTVKVEMTTLDKLISTYGKPAFIKIDVEGYEISVLRGLTQPVKTISFEYCVPEQIDSAIDCISHIQKISPGIECNYSVGESMKLELNKWLDVESMKTHVRSTQFVESLFGDIYIRLK